LVADQQGLVPTAGPLGAGPAFGAMSFAVGGGPLAVGVGQDIGMGVQDFARFQDPKRLGLALGALPFLIGMAASGAKGLGPMTKAELAAGWDRLFANKKAYKVFQEMESQVDPEPMMRYLQNIPDEQLAPALIDWAKKREKNIVAKEQGDRLKAGPRVYQSLSDETKGTQHIAEKAPTIKPAMSVDQITDPNVWAKVDLSGDPSFSRNFRKHLQAQLKSASQRPAEKLKAINREVAQEIMEKGVQSYNKWAKAEAERIKKEGLDETPPTTMTANFRLRDRYQTLLDQYFSSGNEPSRMRNDVVSPKNQTDFKPTNPKMNASIQDLINKGVQPYKTTFMRNNAIKKFFTGAGQEMSNEEFMALLDMGVQSSAEKILKLADAKTKSKQR
jgi:hypothetical protein